MSTSAASRALQIVSTAGVSWQLHHQQVALGEVELVVPRIHTPGSVSLGTSRMMAQSAVSTMERETILTFVVLELADEGRAGRPCDCRGRH